MLQRTLSNGVLQGSAYEALSQGDPEYGVKRRNYAVLLKGPTSLFMAVACFAFEACFLSDKHHSLLDVNARFALKL